MSPKKPVVLVNVFSNGFVLHKDKKSLTNKFVCGFNRLNPHYILKPTTPLQLCSKPVVPPKAPERKVQQIDKVQLQLQHCSSRSGCISGQCQYAPHPGSSQMPTPAE